jgi:hypothetical protein
MITKDNVNDLLRYDGGGLFWKDGRTGTGKAGVLSDNGYLYVSYKGLKYPSHRLVWLIHNGEFPEQVIDHISQNKKDNRIENLRDVSLADNSKNASRSAANKSGVTGVSWDAPRNRWRAQINIDGRKTNLGSFVNKIDAIKARKEAEVGAGYHQNHGSAA